MSERRAFGIFSGRQVTVIVVAAIMAPAAVYGAATYSSVAIVNATSGVTANVDNSGRVSVYDNIAGYRNSPLNEVSIRVSNNNTTCETSQQYTVPNGKAFILTSVTGYVQQYTSSTNYSGFTIYASAGCGGAFIDAFDTSVTSNTQYQPVAINYETGVPIPAGSVISIDSANNYGYTFLHGFLVPAGQVAPGQLVGAAETPVSPMSKLGRTAR